MTPNPERPDRSEPTTTSIHTSRRWPDDPGRPSPRAVAPGQIPRQQILSLIERQLGATEAWRAEIELPERIDPAQHADLLARFGIGPHRLAGDGPGGTGDGGSGQ